MVHDYFSAGSPYLAHPLLTPERTAREIDELERLVGPLPERVLDVGCGYGRHSIEMASRGVDVVGIDPSPAMVTAARERALAANQFADFVCVAATDLREVGRYDLAVCLYGTFGQLTEATTDDAPHLAMLGQVKRSLRPGAKLVIEVPERERTVQALVETEQVGTASISRHYNKRTTIMTERADLDSGAVYVQRYRLFDTTEVVDLVHDAGLDVQQVVDQGLATNAEPLITVIASRTAN